ncbi:Uncharacterized protein PBTT_03092 [Plasmodiophora brassicae]
MSLKARQNAQINSKVNTTAPIDSTDGAVLQIRATRKPAGAPLSTGGAQRRPITSPRGDRDFSLPKTSARIAAMEARMESGSVQQALMLDRLDQLERQQAAVLEWKLDLTASVRPIARDVEGLCDMNPDEIDSNPPTNLHATINGMKSKIEQLDRAVAMAMPESDEDLRWRGRVAALVSVSIRERRVLRQRQGTLLAAARAGGMPTNLGGNLEGKHVRVTTVS